MLSLNNSSFTSFDEFAGSWVGGPIEWAATTEDEEILEARIWLQNHITLLPEMVARFGVEVIGYGAYGLVIAGEEGTCIKYLCIDQASEVTNTFRAGRKGIGPQVHWSIADISLRYHAICMDRVKGMSLEEWAEKGATSKEWQLVWSRISIKLEQLRKERIHHNDLHCGNVILDQELNPWFIDWGFAQTLEKGMEKDDEEVLYFHVREYEPVAIV